MPDPKSYVSKITLPSGNTYYIKDEEAREMITGGVHWIGITTTALTDGATTNPITIGGESVTAVSGDMTSYSETEFIFNGTKWQEMGAGVGILGNMAYVDQGTVTIQPKGSNAASSVSFSGGSTATVVTSYPGATSNLVTGSFFNSATVSNETLTFGTGTAATGSLANDGTGSAVMTGLGTASTETVVKTIGTATAAAQTFTGTSEAYDVNPKSSS